MSVTKDKTTEDDSEANYTLSFTMYFADNNMTSIDGYYRVRLAKKNSGGTWTVLDSEADARKYPSSVMNSTYRFNQSYQNMEFKYLDASTTYRLQIYSIMDTDYDGVVDSTDMTESITVDDKVYYLVTAKEIGTTLSEEESCSLGEYYSSTVGDSSLTLKYKGAYNTKAIDKVEYSLQCIETEDKNKDSMSFTIKTLTGNDIAFTKNGDITSIVLPYDQEEWMWNVAGRYVFSVKFYANGKLVASKDITKTVN
jgi:hypothetical protein